jgi:hypothetical protein
MHDIIGHNLSVIISLADGGAYAAEAAPERSREALRLVGESGRQAASARWPGVTPSSPRP